MLSSFLFLMAFAFGALIGNFATTAYYRIPRNITLFGFDSDYYQPPMCSLCHTKLRFYEYLPVLSWISTLGKCNHCGKKIDASYFILEAVAGFISVVVYAFCGFGEKHLLLLILLVFTILHCLLYKQYNRMWNCISLSVIFTIILLRTLEDNGIFLWIINTFISVIVLVPILRGRRNYSYAQELIFLMSALAVSGSLYIFLLYVISISVYITNTACVMKKRQYLYYGSVVALLIVVFFNYVMPTDLKIFNSRLPDGFVYLSDVAPDIIQDVKYATNDNFTGAVVPGYNAKKIILTSRAAGKLAAIQQALKARGFSLKVFDGYRPVKAVNAFKKWAESTNEDKVLKARFYPNIEKEDLLRGYISSKSTHSRGSTVDLTIVDSVTGQELDMGTEFDFLDPKSNTHHNDITEEQKQNRNMLSVAMEIGGFEGYKMEWWHFKLKDEPFSRYPEDHFDFPIN